MNSFSDASSSAGRLPRHGAVWALVLALGLTAAGLAWLLPDKLDGLALHPLMLVALMVGTAAVLLFFCALGWHVGVRLTRQRLGESLREARMQAQVLKQLQSDWQWSTDAEHHLVCWRAPMGAVASSWVGVAATQALWERFSLDESGAADPAAALRERLQAHANFAEQRVRGADGALWLLRGIALFDGQGHFAGYQGTARALAHETGASPAPREIVLPPVPEPAPDLQEQQAFSYTVSHDLRAPLRVVEGFTRILKEDYGRQLDRVGNDHLDRVMAAAARMNSMIDALLTLSKLSTQPLARQPVNLSQVAGFVLEELCRSAPDRQVDVHVQPHLVAHGDPTLLRLVLENLLGNAWKYSAKCSSSLISFEAVPTDGSEGRCVYCVADNGAGFDMRFADRLFGVFQRLHSASDFQGTGVGLASVRRIVRRHGGDIWAESEPGAGARFYFTLAG